MLGSLQCLRNGQFVVFLAVLSSLVAIFSLRSAVLVLNLSGLVLGAYYIDKLGLGLYRVNKFPVYPLTQLMNCHAERQFQTKFISFMTLKSKRKLTYCTKPNASL